MSKEATARSAMKLSLEALDNLRRLPQWTHTAIGIRDVIQAQITTLREALTSVPDWASEAIEQPAQPQQDDAWKAEQKTLADEAVKCATEALANPNHPATMAAREYYGAAQQEPVAWLHKVTKLMVHADEIAKTSRNEDRINSGEFQALYTSPPAGKPWVGLTPEDKVEILRANGEAAVLILTEAKLKEKNT